MGRWRSIKQDTLMKSKESKPCLVCGESTKFIDYITESRCCSSECMGKMMKEITESTKDFEVVHDNVVPDKVITTMTMTGKELKEMIASMVNKKAIQDEMDELKSCPVCKKLVKYGEMVWLNGQCTCPQCYEHKRREMK